jgi:hypothetical protein
MVNTPEDGKCRDIASMIMVSKRKCGNKAVNSLKLKDRQKEGWLAPGGPWPGLRCYGNEEMQEQSRQLVESVSSFVFPVSNFPFPRV